MKKIVWMLSSCFLLITCSQAFSDVDSSYWADSIIKKWTNSGIISGYSDGSFRPNGQITKAELVTIINKINNDTANTIKRPSKDINLSDWYCEDMAIALKNGIVNLDSDGNLNPKSVLTREDALTIIAKLFNVKYTGNVGRELSKFSDASKIKQEYAPYIAGMVKEEYINGNNGKLNPKDEITRAEIVAVLDNIIEEICTNGRISNKRINGNLILNGENISLSNVQVDGYIYALDGAKNGNIVFNNVYATKGVISKKNNIISYNDGTKKNDNLSNIEEERKSSKIQFVTITYSETGWTNEAVTATLKFQDKSMKVINNSGKNKYKFKENGEFTFICMDEDGNEYRYTAKVNNIAKKDLKIQLDIKDNTSSAEITVKVLKNEAPIKSMYYMAGSHSLEETLTLGTIIENNIFNVSETDTYTVAVKDEAGNETKQEFSWKNTAIYMINVKQNMGGTITPGSIEAQHNGDATFTVTPDGANGYYLADVIVDGISKGPITTYTFTNVREEHTIEAAFRLYKYDIEVIQGVNGKIEPETSQIEYGGSQKFNIIPNEGYEVADVLVDGVSLGAVTEYEFVNIKEKHTITAKYKIKTYSIVVEHSSNGKIEPGTTVVEHGSDITFFITPDMGCEIKNVIVDNASLGPTLAYTFKNVSSSHTIVAVFEEIPYVGALDTVQLGDNVYATIYDDFSCIIYGLGETDNYSINTKPLGFYADQIKNITVKLGITRIGDGIFDNCLNVENIILPSSVTYFGAYAFANCEKLVEVVIPDTMDEIKEGTFYNCKSLERIIIPDSIKIIGNDAFNGCHSMETKTLSKNLEIIGDRAFKDCRGLIDSITVPEGTTKIGHEAFMGCTLLASLDIPNTVEFVGNKAFNDCGTLKNITFKNRRKVDKLGRGWFPNGGDYREAAVGNNYVVTRTTFTITVQDTRKGTITPKTLNVKKFENQEFTMNPDRGYEVENIIIDGTPIGSANNYIFVDVNSTHTIGATFRPTTYKITYKLNGGIVDNVNPSTYTILDSITLNNPTREGYNFVGWTGTGITNPADKVLISDAVGDRVYEAQWKPIEYQILYALDGGTANNPSTYNIETATITLEEPVKPGYEFVGWTNDVYLVPTKPIIIRTGSMGDRIYTANWTLATYTITYNLDGGSEVENPLTYTILSNDIVLVNPTKLGYDFVGWSGTGLNSPSDNVVITKGSYGNREYTAKWSPRVYSIAYDLDGGSLEGTNPESYTIESPQMTLKNPTKDGYEFIGWTGTDIATMSTGVIIKQGSYGNRSYVANWQQL